MIIRAEAVAKGRPRVTKSGHTFTPERTKEWEERVAWEYRKAIAEGRAESFGASEPVRAFLGFFYQVPKSYSTKRRKACQDGSEAFTKHPDLDNLAKAILDALNGIAYEDDRQVVDLHCVKGYSDAEPYVCIIIERKKNEIN